MPVRAKPEGKMRDHGLVKGIEAARHRGQRRSRHRGRRSVGFETRLSGRQSARDGGGGRGRALATRLSSRVVCVPWCWSWSGLSVKPCLSQQTMCKEWYGDSRVTILCGS